MDFDPVVALEEIAQIIAQAGERAKAEEAVVEYLHRKFPHFTWVGIYRVEGEELVLGPWRGPEATEHTRIPIGKGVCGAAAASGRTEVVPDVSKDPRYLACFPYTRSEVVVPIISEGHVRAEIDIDADILDAFRDEDIRFLEQVAEKLAPFYARDQRG
ncbi:MAG: GAF domain-containing protein [Armatimonadota bacterium]|nr:GAF domain-containing protein [Armatimonadota bacterium]MDR5702483.1 GAF domain-containing protein [Armatimonadota bacterium]MDR7433581.1 GAF domain-containing protein [Armatimonadota bacterium]